MVFELLYWCGIRLGELRALTAEDFDFDGYTDLFIKVRYGSVIPVNTGGVYFHYDPTTGLYSEWDALNSVGMLVNVNADGVRIRFHYL